MKHPLVLLLTTLLCVTLLSLIYLLSRPTPVDTSQDRVRRAVDSVQSHYVQSAINRTNLLREEHQREIDLMRRELDRLYLQNRAERQRADSANARYQREKTLQACDSALIETNIVIEGLDATVEGLKTQVSNHEDLRDGLTITLALTDSLLAVRSASLTDCRQLNDRLTHRLEKQNTWLKRNHKWLFFAAGTVTGIIITR